jgi:hypothetical protein
MPSKTTNRTIGIAFDGTLAVYTEWKRSQDVGPPVPQMVETVKQAKRKGISLASSRRARVKHADRLTKESAFASPRPIFYQRAFRDRLAVSNRAMPAATTILP